MIQMNQLLQLLGLGGASSGNFGGGGGMMTTPESKGYGNYRLDAPAGGIGSAPIDRGGALNAILGNDPSQMTVGNTGGVGMPDANGGINPGGMYSGGTRGSRGVSNMGPLLMLLGLLGRSGRR